MMNNKENGKCRWMLTVALILLALFASEKAHAYIGYYYAVLDGTTLTIMGTEQRLEANSFIRLIYESSNPSRNTNRIVDPDFYDKVEKIIIKSNVANADPRMFEDCHLWFQTMHNLAEIEGLKYINTSAVEDMSLMFYHCNNLKSLDLSAFDTSNVTNMESMFLSCDSLKELDLSTFNTSKVTDMHEMFYGCKYLEKIKLDNFDTSNVTDMSLMFYNCYRLNDVDVSKFNTSNVTTMSNMFYNCEGLKYIDVSGWNTSKVKDMSNMFYFAGLKSIDLSNFDVSSLEDTRYMFGECHYLETIYCNDTWTCDASSSMFASCYVLKGATSWSVGKKNDISYANPKSGYFTYMDYDLYLLGTRVGHDNYRNLSVIEGVGNGVTYDAVTNTLNLKDALIQASNEKVIDGCISTIYNENKKTFTINVSGDCKIVGMDYSALRNNSVDLVITGDGTLTLTGSQGIWSSLAAMHTITVKGNVTVNIEGKIYGVRGHSVSGNCFTTLAVKEDARLCVLGKTQDFLDIKALKVGEYIDIQGNYVFNSNAHTVVRGLDGTPANNEVVVIGIKEYPIQFCGVQLNAKNSVLGISDGIKGIATYDNATRTLTLDHFYKYSPADCIIKNYGIDGLTIKAKGTSLLTSLGAGIVQQCNGLTITGDTLMILVSGAERTAIEMSELSNGTLLFKDIKNCVLSSTNYKTIENRSANSVNMAVEGSLTNAIIGGKQEAIVGFNELTLKDGLAIINPIGAKYENGSVTDKDGQTVTTVTIGMLGDANSDGNLTMADANMVVNYFLSTDKNSIKGFDKYKANVNGDFDEEGKPSITMADANQIVNMFLKGAQ